MLKNELGFQGYVMSDWLATHSGIAAIDAGLDMNMPGGIHFLSPIPSFWGNDSTTSVRNGSLSAERIDDMVLRVMTPYFYLGQDHDYPPIDGYTPQLGFYGASVYPHNFTLGPAVDARHQRHAQHIRDLGAAGMVLLKNINRALPLTTPMNIGVFGNDAADLSRGQFSPGSVRPVHSTVITTWARWQSEGALALAGSPTSCRVWKRSNSGRSRTVASCNTSPTMTTSPRADSAPWRQRRRKCASCS